MLKSAQMSAQTSPSTPFSTSKRPVLDEARRSAAANTRIASFHNEIIEAVAAAVEKDAVVVVGMAQNPFVRKTRALLDEAKVPFTYLEYGSYLSEWKQRLAIKLWSGWPTFPQVFVKGVLIGGHDEAKSALADGSLKASLGS